VYDIPSVAGAEIELTANLVAGKAARAQHTPGTAAGEEKHVLMQEEQVLRKIRAFDPDDLDRQIIRLLRADGRRSNREIARTLDVPEATVRYRVRRLIESNILRITASVDPEHLGYGLTAVISVQVEPNRINTVAEEISAMPEVMWVAITAGAHDIMLMGSFRNQEEMFTFLTDRLAKIDGTYRTETSVALRIMKKQHEWASDLTNRVETGLPVAID
jgi:Lrp/AsnC family transcriptional regulator, regulator for asnA, asnC and gidA